MSEHCKLHLLTEKQIKIILKDEKDSDLIRKWTRQYDRVRELYLSICDQCQKISPGDEESEEELLQEIENFLSILKADMVPIMEKNPMMKLAMTLMLCHYDRRCNNHTTWYQGLDTSFMNWIAHRANYMGHHQIGLTNTECLKLGGKTYEVMLQKTKNCVDPKLTNLMSSVSSEQFKKILTFSHKSYDVEYNTRELRHPSSSNFPICGEEMNDEHKFRKNLAKALSRTVSDWLDVLDEEEENRPSKIQRL